jgi:ATPase subunit of ABC transporter with duplicated ATPase domains
MLSLTTAPISTCSARRDAAALADLLLLEDLVPPIAVGVFGPWGSGKSTLIRLLQREIAGRTSAKVAHATAAYRAFAQAGGERPDVGTPAHLAERQRDRDAARQELAVASAAQAQLAGEHAAALREHERREREVAAAADRVIAEMSLAI